jgi:hypothetical protein
MARPKKATVDYFPHMVKHKKTIHIIRNRFGNDGYTFWFVLLEILGSTENHYYDCRNTLSWEFLVAETRVSADICTEILELLATLDAIDAELWSMRVIWCQNLVDGIASVYIKRKTEIPKSPHFLLQKPDSGGHPVAETQHTEVSVTENRQSRVEESRVEEKKHVSFSQFIEIYPARHGNVRGKKEAKAYWMKHITNGKAEEVLIAVKNYADSKGIKAGVGIRDPIRFLRNDYWKDWLEPEETLTTKAGPKKSLNERVKERDRKEGITHDGQ